MLHLIYDTETNGLPTDYKAHVHDVDVWPRVVQLAFKVIDDDFQTLTSRNYLIKPDGWTMSPEATIVNGITTEEAERDGVPIIKALTEMTILQELVDVQVGHNVNFDRKILGAEFIRYGMEGAYEYSKDMLPRICTMMSTTKLCAIPQPSGRGFKWPTLQELHRHLFAEDFEEAHDAMADVNATARCFEQLVMSGHYVIAPKITHLIEADV